MSKIVVIGAGAFGGWTALELRRRGARVTLLDAWGPGNARASSGGETRVIRATYGSRAIYSVMASRALERWRAYDAQWNAGLYRQTGVLWMFGADDAFGRASAETLHSLGIPFDALDPTEAARRFPQISFDGIRTVFWEPEAGYLFARRACAHVVERFVAEGGEYRQAAVREPVAIESGPLRRVELLDGGAIDADVFVFACGPWLGRMFPGVIGSRVQPTRQEVFYFGTPAGDARFHDPAMPVWLDCRDRVVYGIPGNAHRGFKVADDTAGPAIDPTSASREPSSSGIAVAREVLRQRFPLLADAPLLGSEVCQYEATPDSHFIVDRHPAAGNAWIAGGGSGHGFKMGPAIGEVLAACVLDDAPVDSHFRLARLDDVPESGWEEKWA